MPLGKCMFFVSSKITEKNYDFEISPNFGELREIMVKKLLMLIN